MGQQFAVHKVLDVVDDHHHDGLWYHIACGLCNDAHIGIDQIANCLDLPLEQRVQRAARLGLLLLHLFFFSRTAFGMNKKLGKEEKAIIFVSYGAQLLRVSRGAQLMRMQQGKHEFGIKLVRFGPNGKKTVTKKAYTRNQLVLELETKHTYSTLIYP